MATEQQRQEAQAKAQANLAKGGDKSVKDFTDKVSQPEILEVFIRMRDK